MTGPDGPPGRRANGLAAAAFGALVDLDPRLSETLLDRLRSAGVAAYVEPAGSAQPLIRSVTLPSRPLDRLWVDPDRADAAREVVAAEVKDLTALLAEQEPGATAFGLVQAVPRYAANRVLSPPELADPPAPVPPAAAPPAPAPPTAAPPSAAAPTGSVSPEVPGSDLPPPTTDPDELFRQIVADFEREGTSPVPPWPVSEDVPDDPGQSRSPLRSRRTDQPMDGTDEAGRRQRRRTDPAPDAGGELPDWVEPEALDRDDVDLDGGHFEPPPPPALPRIRLRTAVSALGVLLGLLLAFAPSLLDQAETFETTLIGILLLGGGAFGLVTAVRDAPPHERGPDDGAVV